MYESMCRCVCVFSCEGVCVREPVSLTGMASVEARWSGRPYTSSTKLCDCRYAAAAILSVKSCIILITISHVNLSGYARKATTTFSGEFILTQSIVNRMARVKHT